MMVTALLGIVVNIVMGFTLHQGSHKHFHSHIGGGPCSHDHGHSMTNQAPDQYEMIDLAVINKKKPQRSRSLDIRCERNYDRNEFHHHHEREEGGECCDLKDCSVLFDGESKLTPKKKSHHDHAHEGGCCGDHGERVDTDHTGGASHKHSQIQARDFKKDGSRSGSFNKKHDQEDNHEKCEGHDHDHHQDHRRDEEEGHGCGGHHDHEHNHDHDHAECSGHKHDHGHDHGHNHDHAHGGCGGHDHDHNHDHAHENHHNHEHGQGGCGGHDHDHDHDHNHEHPESNYSVDGMNVNIRAAFIHIIGDLIQSVGVFLVSIVIYFKPGWVWFDPLCTVLFSIIVFFTTVPVSQECIRVLMEASPEKVDTEHLRSQIEEIKGVLGVYELRIWNVNETKSVLSAKVLVDKHSSTVMSRVKAICKSYKIYSSTIELQVFKH